ncbi:MAG: plasmid pRiA4b ORF-3 family protein, partial [Actinomycetia bacterium]|nr:plasmid pRiA4b ORF-3 family protein [Actinomycetes bacterium]
MAGPGEKTSGWDGGGWPKGDVAQLLNKLRTDRALLARMGFPDEGPSLLEQYFSNEISLPDPPASPTLLTVTCRLSGAKPPIWRRLELRGDLTLDMLHDCLQAAMGWTDSHLHHFELPMERRRARPRFFLTEFDLEEGEDGTPESEVRLDQVLRKEGDILKYVYDFGDDWEHTLKVEKIRAAVDEDPPA